MLIIEDGTGVAGAQSYATVAQLDAYAQLRGLSLPSTEEEKERLLILAMDYIEAKTNDFAGERRLATQPLSWPRYGMWIFNAYFDDYAIPDILIEAQCDIAARSVGIDLLPTILPSGPKGPVTQETVGPVSVSYATPDTNSSPSLPMFPRAEALLSNLLTVRGGMIPTRKA